MQAKLSILGMSHWDSKILDDFSLPDSVDPQTLKTLIFSETSELEVLYSEPSTFKAILKSWSKSRLSDWKRIELALNAEYNPIENYDRTETHSDVYTRNLAESGESSTESIGTDTAKRAAFNSDTLVDSDSTSTNTSGTDNHSTAYSGGDNREITIKAHGNIGVTTNQLMIEAELQIRRKNLYDIIVNEFIDKFCLGVY